MSQTKGDVFDGGTRVPGFVASPLLAQKNKVYFVLKSLMLSLELLLKNSL